MRRLFFTLFLLAVLVTAGCSTAAGIDNADKQEAADPFVQPDMADDILVISAVGDIMMHNTQLQAGSQSASGDYDYASFFTHVKPLLGASDLAIGNLETTFAGKEATYSGYPRFNTPDALAFNLKNAGFQVVTTANNHCLDKGQQGLFRTLDCLDAAGLLHTGTARSQEESDRILLVERKGVNIAILSYTFGTNMLYPEKDKQFSVNYLDPDQIIERIKKARSEGAKLVIVALHFGVEYQPYPNAEQERIANLLLNEGADVILGHHPHVLQPPSISEENRFVIYSLGNFISDQKGLERISSVILNLTYGIDAQTKQPYFKKAAYIPIKTRRFWQNGKVTFEILPVEAALTSIRTGRSKFSAAEQKELEESWVHITKHLNSIDQRFMLQPLPLPLDALGLIEVWR